MQEEEQQSVWSSCGLRSTDVIYSSHKTTHFQLIRIRTQTLFFPKRTHIKLVMATVDCSATWSHTIHKNGTKRRTSSDTNEKNPSSEARSGEFIEHRVSLVSVFTARRLSWCYICASVKTLVNSLTEQANVKRTLLSWSLKLKMRLISRHASFSEHNRISVRFSSSDCANAALVDIRWSPALAEITEAHSNTYDRLHLSFTPKADGLCVAVIKGRQVRTVFTCACRQEDPVLHSPLET